MKFIPLRFLFFLIFVISLFPVDLYSQNIRPKPTRQSSLETFSKGDYEQAYSEFSELLIKYPKDPLYKYYSGVCLVKLSKDPEEAVTVLEQALQNDAVVKSLPSDASFYLGRAKQMSGMYPEAIKSYNQYIDQAGKRAAREKEIPLFIKQCNELKGELPEAEDGAEGINKNRIPGAGQAETLPAAVIPSEKSYVPAFVKEDYDKILTEALSFQFKADSSTAQAGTLKKESEAVSGAERADFKSRISQTELAAASFQKTADQKYLEALALINPETAKLSDGISSGAGKTEVGGDTLHQPDRIVVADSVIQAINKPVNKADRQSDSIKRITTAAEKVVETFSYFEVLQYPSSAKDVKIILNPEIPEGLIYRLQIAVFRNPVSPVFFKGISPVYGFKISGTDKTSYSAGMFRRSSDAIKALATVKAKGFNDAFIISLLDNKSVSAERAASLEKEWGKRPFISMVKSSGGMKTDTIPPTLTFRVEIIRTTKQLKENMVEVIRRSAGVKGVDIQQLDDGSFAYLTGKFITFESAAEYAGLLIRNGNRDARVVSWLGAKEIPIETARKLFDNLK
jgi:tetratricopeptide (TPR) repeat protein